MKYLVSILFLVVCSIAYPFSSVAPQLTKAANTIQNFKDAKELVATAEKEGPIRVEWKPLGADGFYACWVGDKRTIILNASKQWTEGKKISSILFELHNAKSDQVFKKLHKNAFFQKISKDAFVESIEKQEYLNSKMNSELIDKGIKSGLFPKDAFLPTFTNFEEHFQCQIDYGHSGLIAKQYDQMQNERSMGINFVG